MVALDESNKPYVTGMVFGGSTPEIKTQSGNRVIVQKQSVVVASTLVVEHLMK